MPADTNLSRDFVTLWEEYRKASKRSAQYKNTFNRSRTIVLVLTIAGAILGVLADQSTDWLAGHSMEIIIPKVLAIMSALCLGLVAYLSKDLINSSTDRKWVIARSQAEALKSEAHIYRVKAPPFDTDQRDTVLAEKVNEILKNASETTPMTEAELWKRLPKDWMTMDEYLKERVDDQITWFRGKAVKYQKLLKRFRTVTFALGFVSAILGSIAAALSDTVWPAAWIAVIGSITGALTAYSFAGKYQYLMTSYEATARQLRFLHNEWDRVPDEEKEAKAGEYVRKFEDTLAHENSSWIAKWTGDDKAG